MATTKVDYGIDAPEFIRNFMLGAIGALAIAFGVSHLAFNPLRSALVSVLLVIAVILCLEAGYFLWSSKVGKLRQRDRLLDQVGLTGHETVLDVGCGRGLLLIGAAKRLTNGKCVGIDLWQAEDLTRNAASETLENAKSEGVTERIEVYTGDMRRMPFAAASFDAIISSLAIHNIYSRPGREEALSEIYRVLKPGGRFYLQDIQHAKEYLSYLVGLGAKGVRLSRRQFNVYGARIVSGIKPH